MRRGYEMEIIARRRRLRATSATAVPPVDESCADFIKLVETFKSVWGMWKKGLRVESSAVQKGKARHADAYSIRSFYLTA